MEGTDLDALCKAINDAEIHEKDLQYEISEAYKVAAKLHRMRKRKYRVRYLVLS